MPRDNDDDHVIRNRQSTNTAQHTHTRTLRRSACTNRCHIGACCERCFGTQNSRDACIRAHCNTRWSHKVMCIMKLIRCPPCASYATRAGTHTNKTHIANEKTLMTPKLQPRRVSLAPETCNDRMYGNHAAAPLQNNTRQHCALITYTFRHADATRRRLRVEIEIDEANNTNTNRCQC